MSRKPETAVVTGAGSGIGRGVAQALAGMGLRVALVGRDRGKLEATKALLGVADDRAIVAPCDVADGSAVQAMATEVESAFGAIDVLICNAGTNVRNRALDVLTPEDWDTLIQTNLTGPFNLLRAILPGMRARKDGLVVQVCSIAGVRASVLGGAGYSASKFGQAGLGMTLGRECRQEGIRSTVIYPGEVNTPILDARPVPVPAERKAAILQPEDVAAAVKFLVELHPRARVPELVITPTVDDFY
ncbi:SDR family oxidoreductase [Paludisphaera mucosa]|uniref:SDR family oxidoreductase n=1 Tax=Paludisphaera mucosa TaxID=3030827 RepID=A0ABT6FFJ3_9BACT|nr:SDR family oxidoreductase [Paludisphaera mucosa]MDG3006274.1 SDR family oxidoreductase [Paludisphaera mucosa]